MRDEILFLGDVYLPRCYPDVPKIDHNYVFNLEHPITCETQGLQGKINLKADRCYIVQTFKKRPLAVCLANNHIIDYGEQGILDTFAALAAEKIPYFGAGNAGNNYNNPLLLESSRVALYGYCGTRDVQRLATMNLLNRPAPLDLQLIRGDIRAATENGYRAIIQIHKGVQESAWPLSDSVDLARTIIDCGADMVLFHHAHAIQPVEYYKGKLIAYCLGNYLMDDISVPRLFDANGIPASRFETKQCSWNRQSLGILVEFPAFEAAIKKFMFAQGTITEYTRFASPVIHSAVLGNGGILKRKVEASLRRRKLLRRAYRVLANPRRYLERKMSALLRSAVD